VHEQSTTPPPDMTQRPFVPLVHCASFEHCIWGIPVIWQLPGGVGVEHCESSVR
jgi:hypothetical protein